MIDSSRWMQVRQEESRVRKCSTIWLATFFDSLDEAASVLTVYRYRGEREREREREIVYRPCIFRFERFDH